jgi:uncharacterized glyoxalase superfamily protein PhnB
VFNMSNALAPSQLNLVVGVERPDVDARVDRMAGAGYAIRQIPYDTFWGCRFAVIVDPDGHQIGVMSPSVAEHRFWPPSDAPTHDRL